MKRKRKVKDTPDWFIIDEKIRAPFLSWQKCVKSPGMKKVIRSFDHEVNRYKAVTWIQGEADVPCQFCNFKMGDHKKIRLKHGRVECLVSAKLPGKF